MSITESIKNYFAKKSNNKETGLFQKVFVLIVGENKNGKAIFTSKLKLKI